MIELIQTYPERSALTLVVVLVTLMFFVTDWDELFDWVYRLALVSVAIWALTVVWNMP